MNWTKSSFSPDAGNCVELGTDGGPVVLLRNSNHPDRGTLAFPLSAIEPFVVACAAGELDHMAG
jgi:hypothetical protein